jgi:phenylalanyl-tRNA synthetase beta chain
MKVPYFWLREYCDPGLPASELLDLIALRTTDVEGISYVGPPSGEGFVVGRVVAVEPHPDADRLSVCEVDTGDGTRTIVCGAPNVAAGQTVPVALPGATMPDGEKLGQAKLRGVISDGMILSEAELQIGDDAGGIVVLDDGAAPGSELGELLPLGDPVLELEVHSNRVDCFGVFGVAREVHAITAAPLAEPPWEGDAEAAGDGQVSDYASVTVEVPELCPRFTARVFTDVTIGPSPLWLKARLTAAGQRPINNLVDITNYVMLLTAQPLHAFDLDKVPDGELIVRSAEEGEKMTTLDGVERSFDSDAVLVCDRNGPSGIAGIMGGQLSEVSDSTTRVLLEVATWNGVNILRTSRKLGLRSEASNRFEKQLHPEMAMRAQRIASRLIVELCGARMVPGTIDEAAEIPPPHSVRLRTAKAEGLLGMRIEAAQCSEYLQRLGFGVDANGEDTSLAAASPPDTPVPAPGGAGRVITAEVPIERHYDVTREADLIEEVGRIHGYDEHLPSTLPEAVGQGGRLSREQSLRRRAEDVIRDVGFDAVVNLSLTDPGMPVRLRLPEDDPRRGTIRISNPLSLDHSELRTTLLGSLLDAARYNLSHGAERVALFESGRAYLREPIADPAAPGRGAEDAAGSGGPLGGNFAGRRPAPAHEPQRIGCLAAGPLAPPSWRGDGQPADFYALKGALEALATQLGVEVEVEGGAEPFLHPGRAARVRLGGVDAGWLGEIHPLVCRQWDLEAAAGFEIGLGELAAAASLGREQYEDVTSYPAVQQDLAVIVDEEVPAADVHAAVLSGGGELLRSAQVFDLYRGEQAGEGRKSLALRLTFRAPDRTLTDEEVAELREQIRSKLTAIGGTLRE